MIAYDLDRNTYWIILPEGHERSPDDTGDPRSPEDPATDAFGADEGKGASDRPEDDVEHGTAPPEAAGENSEEDKEEATDASFADREAFEPNELPMSVEFKSVTIGDETRSSGRVYVTFDHRGTTGAHMVAVQLEDVPGSDNPQGEMWLRFDPLTRTLTYSEEQPQVPTIEGD